MGAWSSSILGNDTSCEVRERFFELYDLGENPNEIAAIVLDEQKENLQYDRTNIWLGLALATWECKVLTKEIFNEVKNIVATKEDIEFNRELEADNEFLKKRQDVLETFIKKLSVEKAKPRARKKIPQQVESIYKVGMCLTYKNLDENYIGIYITKSEHYKNKGMLDFFFMDFESLSLPTLEMFEKSRLYELKKLGSEWGHYEYLGNIINLNYEKNAEDFFNYVPKILTLIGQLKVPNTSKLTNNIKGYFMYLINPNKVIELMENARLENKKKFDLSNMTLIELLDAIGTHE